MRSKMFYKLFLFFLVFCFIVKFCKSNDFRYYFTLYLKNLIYGIFVILLLTLTLYSIVRVFFRID